MDNSYCLLLQNFIENKIDSELYDYAVIEEHEKLIDIEQNYFDSIKRHTFMCLCWDNLIRLMKENDDRELKKLAVKRVHPDIESSDLDV